LEVFVESETVGLAEVPHTTPLAVIGEPPSALMLPPLEAEVAVIELPATVALRVAKEPTDVVKLVSAP
jgi:hypothetical protein